MNRIPDIVFWWTGLGAWSVIAILFVLAVLVGMASAAIVVHRRSRGWLMAKYVLTMKDRRLLSLALQDVAGPNNATPDQIEKWIGDFGAAYRKHERRDSKLRQRITRGERRRA